VSGHRLKVGVETMGASSRITVIVATDHLGKFREFQQFLGILPITLIRASEWLSKPVVVKSSETTLEGRARSKALQVAQATIMVTLADTTGLEVDALDGRPGVRSSRFAHEKATDAENNAALLTALAEVPVEKRRARFRTCLALVNPWASAGEAPLVVEGVCEGSIALEARGAGGFGYDPLFFVDEAPGRTMAELAESEKNHISHRTKALRALTPKLQKIVDGFVEEAERVAGANAAFDPPF
jgi:XTP/dITP diphosphohydrolase